MKSIIKLIVVICFLAISASAFEQETDIPSQKTGGCPVCGMLVTPFINTSAIVQFKDSSKFLIFDGPKCMFKYYLNLIEFNHADTLAAITSIAVRDYNSKEIIDAKEAYYVTGSDTLGAMGPELVPFEKEMDANKFLKEHKGKNIIRFSDVNNQLIIKLDK